MNGANGTTEEVWLGSAPGGGDEDEPCMFGLDAAP